MGRGSKRGDEWALDGAEAGVPDGVLNSALSNQGASLAREAVNGVGVGRTRSEGGIGVWMGACGCTRINSGLIVPGVLRAGWWWSADGGFEEPGRMGFD